MRGLENYLDDLCLGNAFLVINQLNDKARGYDSSMDWLYYTLYFNVTQKQASISRYYQRYEINVSSRLYSNAEIGDEYYLVLKQDSENPGRLAVEDCFLKSSVENSEELRIFLDRDKQYTGFFRELESERIEVYQKMNQIIDYGKTPEQKAEDDEKVRRSKIITPIFNKVMKISGIVSVLLVVVGSIFNPLLIVPLLLLAAFLFLVVFIIMFCLENTIIDYMEKRKKTVNDSENRECKRDCLEEEER